jgi:hypothetical protein
MNLADARMLEAQEHLPDIVSKSNHLISNHHC